MNIFIISDLHLGGRPHNNNGVPGSQINSSCQHLTDFIDWLSSGKACNGDVELVINGDIVDFLMEDDFGSDISSLPWTDNEETVIVKLEKIIERTREGKGRGPFDAMRGLLNAGYTLTWILGNHDVELSLPKVRKFVRQLLGGGTGNFNLVYDGEAYTRGGLLIEHGNRYDRFNIIDHSALRQERSAMSRGMPLSRSGRKSGRFKPPAGSILVTEVFNQLKREFRFLDLLKPETGAAIPLLLALHPKLEHVLSAILSFSKVSSTIISSGMVNPAEPRRDGQLAADGGGSPLTLQELLRQEIGEGAKLFDLSGFSSTGQLGAVEMWDNIKTLSRNISIYLNDGDLIFKGKTIGARIGQLKAALGALRSDPSFQLDYETPEYLDAAKFMANNGGFSTVVFGHTHLPKKVRISENDGSAIQYINTGTWADMIKVPYEVLTDSGAADDVLERFMTAMRINHLRDYIMRFLSYAQITLDDKENVTGAALYSFVSKNKPMEAPVSPVEE